MLEKLAKRNNSWQHIIANTTSTSPNPASLFRPTQGPMPLFVYFYVFC